MCKYVGDKGKCCSLKRISMNDVRLDNKRFWTCFFLAEWRNAYNEQEDLSVADVIEANCPELSDDYEWWHDFTGYRDDIFETSDGYLEEPTTLFAALDKEHTLTIEFHPGDTVYFINDTEIGCTGPHDAQYHPLPYDAIEKLLEVPHGEELFFLLLPMTKLDFQIPSDIEAARTKIESLLRKIFATEICGNLADCMMCALTEE